MLVITSATWVKLQIYLSVTIIDYGITQLFYGTRKEKKRKYPTRLGAISSQLDFTRFIQGSLMLYFGVKLSRFSHIHVVI
jgi:hypothetical protein